MLAAATTALASCGPAAPARPGAASHGRAVSLVTGGQLVGVAAAGNSVWAVGVTGRLDPLAVRFDGRSWRRFTPLGGASTSPSGGVFNAVAVVSARDAWVVGEGPYDAALTEHWNGRSWTRAGVPGLAGNGTFLYAVAAVSATSAWAVGESDNKAVIEHWNGAVWMRAHSPAPAGGASLHGVAALSATSAWAVGSAEPVAGGLPVPLIEHWDGAAWRIVPSPVIPGGGELAGIAATSATGAWAVGYSSASGTAVAEHWNGRAWTLPAG
jgi:hypothetical protein